MPPRRVEGVAVRDVDCETVLLAPDCSCMIVLSPMGSVIWDLCDGGRSVQQMAAVVRQSTSGNTIEQITEDIDAFVEQLQRAGFVTGAEPCTSRASER